MCSTRSRAISSHGTRRAGSRTGTDPGTLRNLLAIAAIALLPAVATANPLPPPAVPAGDGARPGAGALHVIGVGDRDVGTPDGPTPGGPGRADALVPLEHTRVEARIDGIVSSVTVTQVFLNPYRDTIEALYVFPLPDDAAVDAMNMQVGDRTVRGTIHRREEARRIYEDAKRRGHVAGLLDQERPNIFTQSVANILPGNRVEITLHYVERLEPENGRYAFVFPMVVGPRFIPGTPVAADPDLLAGPPQANGGQRRGDRTGTGWSPDTDRVPDASRITPPVLRPGERSGHDIELQVEILGGVPIRHLASPSHAVVIERPDPHRARVALEPFDSIPNRDFVLEYELAGSEPELAVLPWWRPDAATDGALRDGGPGDEGGSGDESGAGDDGAPGYFLALLAPAEQPPRADVVPKELIFVVDCSGSMSGEPIAKAKQAMRHALKHLDPRDTFQIIRFSNVAAGFRPHPVPATAANVRDGLRYIERLSGGGGTQMIEGIKASLDYPVDAARLRIVSFMTDGYIGNETEILAAIEDRLGGARLFSFGVGNSVNHYLLDRMAEVGRGAVETVRLGSDTAEVVERFYRRIGNPYLTDVTLEWDGVSVSELYPRRLPDLFLGQTLGLVGRYERPASGTVTVRGRLGGRPWERSFAVELPGAAPATGGGDALASGGEAIATLWGRARVHELMAGLHHGPRPEVERAITEVALRHRLVTQYTSFVAVEERIEVVGGVQRTITVPVEMPEGVSYEGVFGKMATARQPAMLGAAQAMPMMAPPAASKGQSGSGWGLVGAHYDAAAPPGRRARVEERGVETPAIGDGDARERAAIDATRPAWRVSVSAGAPSVQVGDRVTVTLELENVSGTTLEIPWPLAPGAGGVELSIVDDRWHTVEVAAHRPGAGPTATRRVAPGETVRVTLELATGAANAPAAALLPDAGRYHIGVLRVAGSRVDSDRIEVEVRD